MPYQIVRVMDKGTFFGDELIYLDSCLAKIIQSNFIIHHVGWDISVLSEPNQSFNFLYLYSSKNRQLADLAEKIAVNLNRDIIVIHNNIYQQPNNISNITHINEKNIQASNHLSTILERYKQLNSKSDAYCLSHRFNIESTVSYIDEHLNNALTEKDVADHCHLSVNYFSKVFHANVGVSFQEYVTTARIEQAKLTLIQKREHTIANVAYMLGFKDVSYFSRLFKKKTGLTPGQFRKFGNH